MTISRPPSAKGTTGKWSTVGREIIKRWRWPLGLLGLTLAWHALREVIWAEVWQLLAGMDSLAILTLGVVNLLMLPLMTARWWLLLRLLGSPVDPLSVCAYRLAANAVSYLTPGPHFGGEPLAVYLLQHRHGIPTVSAATSVAVDRLLELFAGFIVLSLCLTGLASAQTGLFQANNGPWLVLAVPAVVTWILALLSTGGRPLSRVLVPVRKFCGRFLPRLSGNSPMFAFITQGEDMAAALFRRHRSLFLLANLLSFGHWLGVFFEFWLMSVFLQLPLPFWHLTAVVVVARLAFYTPLPAGIGALESALPWLTATLGSGSSLGFGLCLIIRFRDLLFSLAGLALTMKYLTCPDKAGIIRDRTEQ